MVKYKVVVTPRAQTSIRRIVERLRRTVSQQTADHVRRGINEAIDKLRMLPESHEVEHIISDDEVEFRRVLKWDYRIIFNVDRDEIIVSVVEIVSSSQSEETIRKKLGK